MRKDLDKTPLTSLTRLFDFLVQTLDGPPHSSSGGMIFFGLAACLSPRLFILLLVSMDTFLVQAVHSVLVHGEAVSEFLPGQRGAVSAEGADDHPRSRLTHSERQ